MGSGGEGSKMVRPTAEPIVFLNEGLGDVGQDEMENKRNESVEEECKGRTRIYT